MIVNIKVAGHYGSKVSLEQVTDLYNAKKGKYIIASGGEGKPRWTVYQVIEEKGISGYGLALFDEILLDMWKLNQHDIEKKYDEFTARIELRRNLPVVKPFKGKSIYEVGEDFR